MERELGGVPAMWQSVCADLWNVLGKRTEAKAIRMERLLVRPGPDTKRGTAQPELNSP